jgi:hypothetical protein
MWYAADVTASDAPFPGEHGGQPVRVGDSEQVIARARAVGQFQSGVFAGVPAAVPSPWFRSGGLWTDDPEGADIGDAIVEIRAFDATYLDVATRDVALVYALADRFAGSVILGGRLDVDREPDPRDRSR